MKVTDQTHLDNKALPKGASTYESENPDAGIPYRFTQTRSCSNRHGRYMVARLFATGRLGIGRTGKLLHRRMHHAQKLRASSARLFGLPSHVDQWSIWRDIKIILQTFRVILHRNAY